MKENIKKETYLRSQVVEACTDYFKGDVMAAEVWANKYALKDKEGNIYELTPDDMHRRLAKEFARIEKLYKNPISEDEIFELLKNFKYIIPQGSPMAGIGNNFQFTSLSNCFVIGNDADSYGGILKLDQELVQLQKRRAGVGLDLSFVRPEGSIVLNSAMTSTGVVPFMQRYSNSTREVAQDGRRGALMETISIVHPDSEKFIDAKMQEGKVTGANISVKLIDSFMEAALSGEKFTQQYPVDSENPVYKKEVDAKRVWEKIIHNAWKCVPYDTEIVVYDELDKFYIKKIGEIVKEKKRFKVLSLNLQTFKVEKKEIVDFQEYENNKKLFLLKTKKGREILSTSDHIVYILKENKLKEIPICEVKSGDFLIVSNKNRLDENDFNDELELDLKYFENSSITFDDFHNKLDNEKIINCLGFYEKSSKVSHYLKNKKIPIKEFIKIKEELGNLQNIKITYANTQFNAKFKVSNELMLFFGLWIAKGSYHGTELLLHINKNEIQYYEKIFNYISDKFDAKWKCEIEENYAKITFSSFMLVNFCKSIGCDYENKNKKIPNWIHKISLNKIGYFLNGIFSGDGTVSKKGAISLSQSNKKIIEEVRDLLLMFGIQSSIHLSEKEGKKIIKGINCNIKNSYKLRISKSSNNLFYEKISFVLENKKNRISLDNTKNLSLIPLSKDKLNTLRAFGRKTISKSLLIEKIKELNIDLDLKILSDDVIYEEVECVLEEKNNVDKVYDITVKDNHTFILSNGCIISNSAEPGVLFWDTILRESLPDCYADLGFKTVSTNPCGEIFLCPDDSCRLLSINLYSYVVNPFTKNAYFDFELFSSHVNIAQRMMDDMIDLELEKIDSILSKIESDPEPENIKRTEKELWLQIKDKAGRGRRCGLGITAEGDMLAALGLTYGNDDAIDFSEKVHKILKLEAYRSSVNLAKERGAFEIWDASREVNNPFVNRIKQEDEVLYNDMMIYGRRNIAILTIAPTGTVSMMTQTTSGIEPVFLPSYKRRRKINPQEKNPKIDFRDKQGDAWQEYQVFHLQFEKWLEVNGYNIEEVKLMSTSEVDEIIKKSPYYKATSADVDWVKKVEMQGRIQKHVDHSISVTVNLPSDVSEELVAKVYETGWKVGCKGLTVYRDGCRDGVLISGKEEKEVKKVVENNATKRPKVVNADVFTFQNNYEKWIAIVGKVAPFEGHEEIPYELFTGRLESFQIPSYVEKGQVIKRKVKDAEGKDVSVYDFKYIDKDGYPVEMAGLSRSFREEFWNYAKLISAILRHRMPMVYVLNVISGLKLQGDSLNTWKSGVERVLRKYIANGTESHDTCELCGAKLIYIEGCLKCSGCGQYSKCG